MRNRKLVLAKSNKDFLGHLQDLKLNRLEYIYAYSRAHLCSMPKGTKVLYAIKYELSPEFDEIVKEIEIRELELLPLESEIETENED